MTSEPFSIFVTEREFRCVLEKYHVNGSLESSDLRSIVKPLMKTVYKKVESQWDCEHNEINKQILDRFRKTQSGASYASSCSKWIASLDKRSSGTFFSVKIAMDTFNQVIVASISRNLNQAMQQYHVKKQNDQDTKDQNRGHSLLPLQKQDKSSQVPLPSLKNTIMESVLTKHEQIQSLLQSLSDNEIDKLDGDATMAQIQNHYDDIIQLIEQGRKGYNKRKRSRSEFGNSKNSEMQRKRRKTEIQSDGSREHDLSRSAPIDRERNSVPGRAVHNRQCGRFRIRIQAQDQQTDDDVLHIGPRNFSIDEIYDILTKQNWNLIVLLKAG